MESSTRQGKSWAASSDPVQKTPPPLKNVILLLGAFVFSAVISFAQNEAPVVTSRVGGAGAWTDLKSLTAAANAGNPAAQAELGEQLLHAAGAAQDVPRALELLEKAARAGQASAAFRIGMLLDDGDGVAQDRVRALAYFKAAAVGGVAEAFHNVGAAYVGAHGIKRNYPEGLAWLILATKHGVGAESELEVRTRLAKIRHRDWIAAAESRARELELELGKSSVAAELPPASSPLHYVPSGTAPAP